MHFRFGGHAHFNGFAQRGHAGKRGIDVLFAQADTNKDGKLTKEEVANFVWSRLAKADVNHQNAVTKEELKNYFKRRFETLRAEHTKKAHKAHHKHKHSKPATKPEEKPKTTPKTESKPDTKAEAKPEPKPPANAAAKPVLKGNSTAAVKSAASERVKDPKAGASAA